MKKIMMLLGVACLLFSAASYAYVPTSQSDFCTAFQNDVRKECPVEVDTRCMNTGSYTAMHDSYRGIKGGLGRGDLAKGCKMALKLKKRTKKGKNINVAKETPHCIEDWTAYKGNCHGSLPEWDD